MIARIELQPAWVLHAQPFQNTSLLVDFFSLDYGRVRAVAKGARRPNARNKALLQPFQPLLVSMMGRNDLKNQSWGVQSAWHALVQWALSE
jgi:DNA repair protein RecO (recombination protein O)